MEVIAQVARSLPTPAGQHATRMAFFVAGFGTASWAPLVPYARDRLGIDAGGLGLLLLCLGAGSIITMPLSGALATRFGCRCVICAASLLVAASLPFLATVSSAPLLAVTLLGFGAGLGALDVAMNVQAVMVERAADRALMSGFHGLFSVGGIAGSAGMSGLLRAGLSPFAATLGIAGIMLGLLAIFGRHLLPYGGNRGATWFALPRGKVLVIGIMCFVVFLAEGTMLDWGAVLLTSSHGMTQSGAGIGYAIFSFAMATGRLTGDRIVQALGGAQVLAIGGSCAALGLALMVVASSWANVLIGFAMVGLGASNIVPVLYSVLGRQRVMAPNLAVAAVTTLGFTGILVGPAVIGLVAHVTSLGVAFLGVAALLIAVAASARTATQ